jgi:hypothetical protein
MRKIPTYYAPNIGRHVTIPADDVRVEIRTSHADWAREFGTPGREGRTVVVVPGDAIEHLTFAGTAMIRFDMATVAPVTPADWPNRWAQIPASWVVA